MWILNQDMTQMINLDGADVLGALEGPSGGYCLGVVLLTSPYEGIDVDMSKATFGSEYSTKEAVHQVIRYIADSLMRDKKCIRLPKEGELHA